jgi:hypothetical protein
LENTKIIIDVDIKETPNKNKTFVKNGMEKLNI